jgi:hypothetical protein
MLCCAILAIFAAVAAVPLRLFARWRRSQREEAPAPAAERHACHSSAEVAA